MAHIKKDVNSVLLFLVTMTCIALVALTVVFANQFDGLAGENTQMKVELESTNQALSAKTEKLNSLNELLDKHIEREKELENMLKNRLSR
ncbi:hypothetical protein HY837_06595 [archaeon]|nr:hypothetical protein [archaeon]